MAYACFRRGDDSRLRQCHVANGDAAVSPLLQVQIELVVNVLEFQPKEDLSLPMAEAPSGGTQGSLDPTESIIGFAAGRDSGGGHQLKPGEVLGERFTIIQF